MVFIASLYQIVHLERADCVNSQGTCVLSHMVTSLTNLQSLSFVFRFGAQRCHPPPLCAFMSHPAAQSHLIPLLLSSDLQDPHIESISHHIFLQAMLRMQQLHPLHLKVCLLLDWCLAWLALLLLLLSSPEGLSGHGQGGSITRGYRRVGISYQASRSAVLSLLFMGTAARHKSEILRRIIIWKWRGTRGEGGASSVPLDNGSSKMSSRIKNVQNFGGKRKAKRVPISRYSLIIGVARSLLLKC